MKNANFTDEMTQNYMKFCYMCDDASKCTTEEQCRACWASMRSDEEQETCETTKYMKLQYA